MSLKQRLQALRQHRADGPLDSPASDLGPRLDRLRLARRAAGAPRTDQALASLLGGVVGADGLIEIERRFGLGHGFGAAFGDGLGATLVAGLPDGVRSVPAAWVFIDTETTGLAGGSGTLVFLVGLARLQGDDLVLRQFLATRFAGEAAMLRRAAAWLGEAGLISYNGKTFDGPLLSTRCRLTRQPDWVGGRPHLDLLYPVRRAFAGCWPDCRLATVERALLGVRRSQDLPGAEAPAAWFAHLQAGDASRLPGVLRHNAQDLHSLALLVPQLAQVYARPESRGAGIEAVAAAWLRRGHTARALSILERNRGVLTASGLHVLARLYRRDGAWRSAGAVWRELAATGDCAAIEQLAKYEEHVRRDPAAAADWAAQLPPQPAREQRLRRLARKGAAGTRTLPFD